MNGGEIDCWRALKTSIQMSEKKRLDERNVQKLVKKAKAGDKRAFEQLVCAYQKPLYYAIDRIVLNHDDTDDVLQDTFVKMYQNLALFETHRPLYPWLVTIAINLAINKKKWRARKSEDALERVSYAASAGGKAAHQEQEMDKKELENALRLALRQLSVELRAVFVLRVHDELSYEEISKMLGISMGTVMSRLARGREKLRGLLAPYLENHSYKVNI